MISVRPQLKHRALVVMMALTLGVASTAQAGTTTGTMATSATLTSACTLTTQPNVSFGSLSTLQTQTSGAFAIMDFQVKCSQNTALILSANGGSTTGGTTSVRKLVDAAGDTINYTMTLPQATGQNFGNTVGTDTYSVTPNTGGSGSSSSIGVNGKITAGQTILPGTYTDTVTITGTY